MAKSSQVYLNILWHQHQPWYVSPSEQYAIMPWVRLHGIKDYYDMAWLCQHYEGWKQTINLVPSLLQQIILYTEGELTDSAMPLSRKDPQDLTREERIEVLERFFDANTTRMIQPYSRYKELHRKRGSSPEDSLDKFSDQDIRDLQVWFNLTWFDPIWRENKEAPLAELVNKERDFTEEEKHRVLDFQIEVMKKIIPIHREQYEQGNLELTTTPFYHPILPLLCDSNIAKVSNPHDPVPEPPYQHPEDAEWHLQNGLKYFENLMGFKPKGMWPSEGSVSDAACALMAQEGMEYFATDEEVLFHSQAFESINLRDQTNLFRLHRLSTPHGEIDCVFRDHGLSDGIGFHYANEPAKSAAKRFIQHLKDIGNHWKGDHPPLVNVILDGENCWEFYPNDGHDFLRYMIEGIIKDKQVTPTTVPEYRELFPPQPTLQSIFPASWIYRNFRIWIGHHEDNTAWHLLKQARDTLCECENELDEEKRKEAWNMIYIAEGSDWYWWYGDEHHSAHDFLFDRLFREHLLHIYTLLERPAPEILNRPIKKPRTEEKGGGIFMLDPRSPTVTDSYYSWTGARVFSPGEAGGAMHLASHTVAELAYGRYHDKLALRLHFDDSVQHPENVNVTLHVSKPLVIDTNLNPAHDEACESEIKGAFLEAMVDLSQWELNSEQECWFFLEVEHEGQKKEYIPDSHEFHVPALLPSNASLYWFI